MVPATRTVHSCGPRQIAPPEAGAWLGLTSAGIRSSGISVSARQRKKIRQPPWPSTRRKRAADREGELDQPPPIDRAQPLVRSEKGCEGVDSAVESHPPPVSFLRRRALDQFHGPGPRRKGGHELVVARRRTAIGTTTVAMKRGGIDKPEGVLRILTQPPVCHQTLHDAFRRDLHAHGDHLE